MENIFQNEKEIKTFVLIQTELVKLIPNSSDEEIDTIVDIIPENYLNQKDELMTICQIFAYYARFQPVSKKGNAIKLFQRLLKPIKTHLQNQSTFFWSIFGGSCIFKLWMYEEGLIPIDQILQSAQGDKNHYVSEFFYPEIFETNPKIYEEVTKYQLKSEYSKEQMETFKKQRKNYFNWLLNSGNYKDASYLEIEKDSLRLSIKRDDFDTFQKILSGSNMSVNSKIHESVLENEFFYPHPIPLIELAILSDATNIYKFLLLKNAEMHSESFLNSVIRSGNYEIIRTFESNSKERFAKIAIYDSISCWNQEMIDYIIDNYDFEFLFKSGINIEKGEKDSIEFFQRTFYSLNFKFFELILLPFLRKNENYFHKFFHEIACFSFYDMSCFFVKELLKYPYIDINELHVFSDGKRMSLLGNAIQCENYYSVELLLKKFPNIKINEPVLTIDPPFQCACRKVLHVDFLKLISNFPNFDINTKVDFLLGTSFGVCATSLNYLGLQFVIDNSFKFEKDIFFSFYLYTALKNNNFYILKMLLNELIKKSFDSKITDEIIDSIVETFDRDFQKQDDYNIKYVNTLKNVVIEMKNQINKY